MYQWHNYPWTNFNELNLDWIMRLLKEIQVEAIPALEEKIDNVYEYIRENLPEIISSIVSVVIDVKAAGATGDGVTDDSAAIEQALTMGDVLFFPEGTYRFKEIEVNKPVYMLGNHAELIPIHKHPNTNQSYCLFKFYDYAVMQGFVFNHDNSVVSQSGTQYITEAAIQVYNSECFMLEDCHVKNFFETYRQSISGIDFEDRHGMFLRAHNCEFVSIHNCEFNDFGGQELMWIAQDRARYSKGFLVTDSCRFFDRNSGDTGSVYNVLGGTMIFTNNVGRNYNNIYTGGTTGGSLFNFMCPYVNMSDNVFTDCVCGSYFDLSEGYWNKIEVANVCNNIWNGNSNTAFRAMAKELYIKGNNIDAERILNTLCCNSTPTTGVPYHVDDATLYDFDVLEISDNNFNCTLNPYGAAAASSRIPVFINQTQDASGSRAVLKTLVIEGNTFVRSSDAVSYNTIYIYAPAKDAHIIRNTFKGTGATYPTGHGGRCIVSGNEDCDNLNISYNIVDVSMYSDANETYVATGGLDFRQNAVVTECFNMGFGNNIRGETHGSDPLNPSTFTHFDEDYNYNITP